MLIVRDGETPYHQLTREEVRRWQIVDDEGVNGEKLAQKKQRLANTPYSDSWPRPRIGKKRATT